MKRMDWEGKYLLSTIALLVIVSIAMVISSRLTISPTEKSYIYVAEFLAGILGVCYLGWQWCVRKIPFHGLQKSYWHFSIFVYRMELKLIDVLPTNSWLGLKRSKVERKVEFATKLSNKLALGDPYYWF